MKRNIHVHHNHDNAEDSLLKAEMICEDKNLKFTTIRKKVFRLILSSKNPIKAYDILDLLKKKEKDTKPPTVYRALDFLLANGLIHRLPSLNSYVNCAHPLRHKQCYFLICSKCNDTTECCNDKLLNAIEDTAKSNKFSMEGVFVEVYGKCSKCSH